MSFFGSYVLIQVFAAFLPPKSSEDCDFYDVLGVPRAASEEDIRKAYKKKSLALHPDKVAQFGRGDPEAAAREYEQVQRAYTVLSNPKKRKLYHAVQCSPTRYHFVESGTYQNLSALMENLAHASPWTKLRLVTIVGLIFCLLLLQPILLAAKLNQTLGEEGGLLRHSKWTVVLIPLWIFHGLLVLLLLGVASAPSETRWSVLLTALNQASWLLGELLLALRWDRFLTNHYAIIFIPIYVGMFFRCFLAVYSGRQVTKDIGRMVSSNYMMEKVLNGRDLDELSEEERQEIFQKYIVVHVPPDVVIEAETDEALEQGRVESSPEFENAQEVLDASSSTIWKTVIFGVTFVALVVSKLDDKIGASWWVVFSPIWIYLGSQFLYSGYTCCCGSVSGHEIIFQVPSFSSSGENNNNTQETEGSGKQDVRSSNTKGGDLYVAAEGSGRDFNKQSSAPIDTEKAGAGVEPDVITAANAKETGGEQGVSKESATPESNDSGAPESIIKDAAPADAKQDATNQGGGGSKQHDHDEEQPHFHIDEETFRAWQSAYAEAESSAQQEQARAVFNCLVVSFQTLMLCLVVGKLENDYHSHPPQGYNAMWVLFPVFLFVGLCFFCCACVICGAAVPEMEEHVESCNESHKDSTEAKVASTAQVVSPPLEQPTVESTNVSEHTDRHSSDVNDITDLD